MFGSSYLINERIFFIREITDRCQDKKHPDTIYSTLETGIKHYKSRDKLKSEEGDNSRTFSFY